MSVVSSGTVGIKRGTAVTEQIRKVEQVKGIVD